MTVEFEHGFGPWNPPQYCLQKLEKSGLDGSSLSGGMFAMVSSGMIKEGKKIGEV